MLACQVLWGIGATFLGGEVEAWITDEVGDERVGTMAGIPGAVALGWSFVQVP